MKNFLHFAVTHDKPKFAMIGFASLAYAYTNALIWVDIIFSHFAITHDKPKSAMISFASLA